MARRLDPLQCLEDAVSALFRVGSPADVAEAMLGVIAACGARLALVSVLGPEGFLEVASAVGFPPEELARYRRIPISSPLPMAVAARERRPVWLPTPEILAARYPELADLAQEWPPAWAALPLEVGDQGVGVLLLGYARPRQGGFDEDERRLALLLARLCAVGLRVSGLIETEREGRRRTEEAVGELERERNFVRALLDTAGALIVLLDREGHIVRWNRAAERLTGYTLDEVRDRPYWQVLAEAADVERLQRAFAEVGRFGLTNRYESFWLTKRGERAWIAWSSTVMLTEAGEVAHVLSVGIDMTARRRAEQERARLAREAEEAVRLEEELLSIASHDLRAPLAALRLQSDAMIRELRASDSPTVEKTRILGALEKASATIARMSDLLGALLDASRRASRDLAFRPEPVDLAEIVRAVVEKEQASLEAAECELRIRVQGAVVGSWDRLRLEQIFENLLANAMKYGAGQPIDVLLVGDRERARLSVRDFGIGVPPERREAIFERFETGGNGAKGEGWGLGLWIVRQNVAALGGRVWVETPEGPGSLFVVEVPLAVQPRPTSSREGVR